MKKTYILLTLLAVALASGLLFVSCDTPPGPDPNKDSTTGGGGATVIAQGIQVKVHPDDGSTLTDSTLFTDSTFTGDFGNCNYFAASDGSSFSERVDPITQYVPDSSIKVTNGKLTMTLGVPKAEYMASTDDLRTGITVSPSGAKLFIHFWGSFYTSDMRHYLGCIKTIGSAEVQILLYADRDVNVSGTYTDTYDDGTTITTINWSLKKGWNYVLGELSGSGSTGEVKLTSSTTLPAGFNWVITDR